MGTRRGPLAAEEVVLVLLSQAALALDKTHAAGIVHRDLKPQNLFLTTRDDGSPLLKILDFGIAKVVASASQATQGTEAVGTPVYMAPEQTTGDGTIGPPADLYALGHIAFTLLSGQPYWQEERRAPRRRVRFPDPHRRDGPEEEATVRASRCGVTLPAAFDAWFAQATAPSPAERFGSASDADRRAGGCARRDGAAGLLLAAPPKLGQRLAAPRAGAGRPRLAILAPSSEAAPALDTTVRAPAPPTGNDRAP